MKGRLLMVQGTASQVGTRLRITGQCQISWQDRFEGIPFRAPNIEPIYRVTCLKVPAA